MHRRGINNLFAFRALGITKIRGCFSLHVLVNLYSGRFRSHLHRLKCSLEAGMDRTQAYGMFTRCRELEVNGTVWDSKGVSTSSIMGGMVDFNPAPRNAASFYICKNCKIGDRVKMQILIQDIGGEPESPCL